MCEYGVTADNAFDGWDPSEDKVMNWGTDGGSTGHCGLPDGCNQDECASASSDVTETTDCFSSNTEACSCYKGTPRVLYEHEDRLDNGGSVYEYACCDSKTEDDVSNEADCWEWERDGEVTTECACGDYDSSQVRRR